jgi:hypothetical protein
LLPSRPANSPETRCGHTTRQKKVHFLSKIWQFCGESRELIQGGEALTIATTSLKNLVDHHKEHYLTSQSFFLTAG